MRNQGDCSARTPEWGLANVYTIARRRLNAKTLAESEREWWQHVVRIAEESGVRQPGVLRHAVPTEITDGEGVPNAANERGGLDLSPEAILRALGEDYR